MGRVRGSTGWDKERERGGGGGGGGGRERCGPGGIGHEQAWSIPGQRGPRAGRVAAERGRRPSGRRHPTPRARCSPGSSFRKQLQFFMSGKYRAAPWPVIRCPLTTTTNFSLLLHPLHSLHPPSLSLLPLPSPAGMGEESRQDGTEMAGGPYEDTDMSADTGRGDEECGSVYVAGGAGGTPLTSKGCGCESFPYW